MTTEEKKRKIIERLKKLSKLIQKHNYHYHTNDKPLITDREYDLLIKENNKLESTFPNLKLEFNGWKDSPQPHCPELVKKTNPCSIKLSSL